MSPREVLRLFLVVVLFLVVQYTVAIELRIAGAHPDVVLLLAIAGGLVGGPELGAGLGFVAGFATDLFLPGPFGLSALVLCIVGFTVGYVMEGGSEIRRESMRWLPPLVALAASAVGVILYGVVGAVLGQQQMLHVDLVAVVVVVSVVNALLSPLATRTLSWAVDRPTAARRRARLMDRSLGGVR